jgi:hypothetical protein
MNVQEISEGTKGTLPHYFAVAIGMTIATVWIIMAYQCENFLTEKHGFFMRLLWPVLFLLKFSRIDKLSKINNMKAYRAGAGDQDVEMQERNSPCPPLRHRG